MVTIDNRAVMTAFTEFKGFYFQKTSKQFISMHECLKYLDKINGDYHELYKYEVYDNARDALGFSFWKQTDVGSGKILVLVKGALKANENLVHWDTVRNFDVSKDLKKEQDFFDFYKNKIKPQDAFDSFMAFDYSYQMIAYLFFIQNIDKYMPISQERFDFYFEKLGIDFKTCHNRSWDNYQQYLDIIKHVQGYLKEFDPQINLLDTHSFLWIWGNTHAEREGKAFMPKHKNAPNNKSEEKQEHIVPIIREEEKRYEPVPLNEIDLTLIPEELAEIDFINRHKKQIENGKRAEEIVCDSEKEYLLKIGKTELAEKVKIVGNDPKIGCDVISYDKDGKQKQIEVKAISIQSGLKTFYLSHTQLHKCNRFPNYWIYCVDLDQPDQIIKLKQPDLRDGSIYSLIPESYRVQFK